MAKAPRKKLTVMQLLPELNSGGVERGTLEVSRALVAAGHRSLVVSAGGRMQEQLVAEEGEHFAMPIGRKRPDTLALIRPLARLIEGERVDILHLRSRLPAWIGYAAYRTLPEAQRPKLVSTVHGLYSVNAYSAVMTKGDAVIAVSETVRDYLRQNFPQLPAQRIHLIHRGVDGKQFPPGYSPPEGFVERLLQPWPQAKGRRLLVFPARVTRWKGHLALVRLLSLLQDLDLQVLVVGEVRWNKRRFLRQIKRQASHSGVLDRLSFLGHRKDMRDIYAASDLVLHLSEQPEAFGRVAAEALAMGVPVAGWDQGGIGEILRTSYSTGAVPPQDFQLMADRVRSILQDGLGVQELRATPCAFPLATMQQKVLHLYRQVAPS